MSKSWIEDEGNGIVRHVSLDDYGTFHERNYQDAQPILDLAKEQHNHNGGSSPSGDLKWSATIPLNIVLKWKLEEGLDVFNLEHADRLKKKLNDPEWRYLRIWAGRL